MSPLRQALAAHLGQVLTPEVAAAIETGSQAESYSFKDLISIALKEDPGAVDFFMLMRNALHFWDDLVDGDKPMTCERINAEMFHIMVDLPKNSFYLKHQEALSTVLVNAVGNWHAANQFEGGNDERLLQLAYVIRSDYANLLIQSAYLVGGYDWMMQITPIIRSHWTKENFGAYKSNLEREKAAKNGTNAELLMSWYEQETNEYLAHGLTVFNAAMLADTEEAHVDVLLSLIEPPDNPIVVDMGCGVGGVSRLMKARIGGEYFGVTNVQAQVNVMNALGGVTPVLCDYHSVPFDSQFADVVMFNESIGYGRLKDLLLEAKRLLKPGGVIAIKDGVSPTGKNEWSSGWLWNTYKPGVIDSVASSIGIDVVKSHEVAYSMERYQNFINSSHLMFDRYGEVTNKTAGQVVPSWFWLLKRTGD